MSGGIEVTGAACGDTITDRGDEHRTSVCLLVEGHPASHFDPVTEVHWTDADHYPGSEGRRNLRADLQEALDVLKELTLADPASATWSDMRKKVDAALAKHAPSRSAEPQGVARSYLGRSAEPQGVAQSHLGKPRE